MQGYSKILCHSSENESYWEDPGALVLRGHCHSKNDDFFFPLKLVVSLGRTISDSTYASPHPYPFSLLALYTH